MRRITRENAKNAEQGGKHERAKDEQDGKEIENIIKYQKVISFSSG